MPTIPRFLLILLFLFAAFFSVEYWQQDRKAQRAIESVARRWDIDKRRSEVVETLAFMPAADLGADVVGDAILNDASGEISLRDMGAAERQLWLSALIHINDEITSGREILLDAVSIRPGWAYHWTLLSQLAYTRWRREGPDTVPKGEWLQPSLLSCDYAPGEISGWTFLGGVFLENWSLLSSTEKAKARQTFSRAFLDNEFVQRNFMAVYSVLGANTLPLIPDRPGAVSAALREAEKHELPEAMALVRRWESAERASRTRDIGKIQERIRLDDPDGLKSSCVAWFASHRIGDFADVTANRQLAQALSLCDQGIEGRWMRDARSNLVQAALDGSLDLDAQTLLHTVMAMRDVPDVVRARAALRAGDPPEALRIQREADAAGALEWTPFTLDLAAYYVKIGHPEKGRQVLGQLPSAASEECRSLLTARVVARAQVDEAAARTLDARLSSAWHRGTGPTDRHRGTSLVVCLADPVSRLTLHMETAKPGLLDFGWDGQRAGTLRSPGTADVTSPVAFEPGVHTFFVRSRGGAPQLWSLELH